jgi:hypothetical protein
MGLRAADFWALSLPEWRALCRARLPPATAPLTRAGFDRLLASHPDIRHD